MQTVQEIKDAIQQDLKDECTPQEIKKEYVDTLLCSLYDLADTRNVSDEDVSTIEKLYNKYVHD